MARHQPKPGLARHRDPACQIDRVVTAELGAVDLGMGHEGGAVALVAEAPDGAGLGGLEIGDALGSPGIGKIGDGVVTLDRERHVNGK